MSKSPKTPFWMAEQESANQTALNDVDQRGPSYDRDHDKPTNDLLLSHAREDAAAAVLHAIRLREEVAKVREDLRRLELGFLILFVLMICQLAGWHR